MTTAAARLASPELEATRQACQRAMSRCPTGVQEYQLSFADRPVTMRVAGDLLAQRMAATFEHLIDPRKQAPGSRSTDDAPPPVLRIDLWDRAHTGVGCPGVPFIPEVTDYLDAGLLTLYANGSIARYERPQSVTCLDRPAGHILSCRRDARELALYEQSKPFPEMLAVWYRDQGVLQLHAGLVSLQGRGVLFVGQSGSGKSTTTLACALDGFDYLGDDFVGLAMSGEDCRGYSFYNGARVDEGHLQRFEQLLPHVIPPACQWDLKSMVLMSRVIPGRMARSTRIAAVVRTRVVGSGPTRLAKASKVQTFLGLAPSTLSVPLSAGAAGFLSLMDFLPRVPCFSLELGQDVSQVPGVVRQLLDQCRPG